MDGSWLMQDEDRNKKPPGSVLKLSGKKKERKKGQARGIGKTKDCGVS